MMAFAAPLLFLGTAIGLPLWLIRRCRSYLTVLLAAGASVAICYGALVAGGLYAASDPDYDGLGAALLIFFGWVPAVWWVGILTALRIAALRRPT